MRSRVCVRVEDDTKLVMPYRGGIIPFDAIPMLVKFIGDHQVLRNGVTKR